MIAKFIKSLFSKPEKLEPVSVKESFLDIFKSEMQETISKIENLDKDFEEAEKEIQKQIELQNEIINRDGFVKSAVSNKLLFKSRLSELPELKEARRKELLSKLKEQHKNITDIEGTEFEKSEENGKVRFTPKTELPFMGPYLSEIEEIEKSETYPSRNNMPQLDDTQAFIDYLIGKGCQVKRKSLEAHRILHKQIDLDGAKIDSLAKEYSEGKEYKPVIISSEGFVLDGNHRIAAMKKNGATSIEVDQADKGFDELRESAFEFLAVPEIEKASKQELKEMVEEHEQLVDVLESDSHEDDKKEAKKQEKELGEYKKKLKKSMRKYIENTEFAKAEYQGKDVELEKPFRLSEGKKKFGVYVKNEKGNVIMVKFGDPNMSIKRDDPESKANFRARHNCDEKKDKTTPGYWSCKFWSGKKVSDLVKSEYEDKVKKLLDGYGVESPEELDEEKKKEFFERLDKIHVSDKEKKGKREQVEIEKSEQEQFEEFISKAKYIKREGGPGNYRYYYSDGGGGASSKKEVEAGSGFSYTPQEGLSKEHKEIEERFGTYLKENFEEAKARYEAANGSILNTDNARELSDDYENNRAELSAAVHEPASSFIKKLYAEKLAQPAPKGKINQVLFTAGGTGAGKTTGMEKADAGALQMSQIIYDTNMNGFEKSKKKIDQALAAGKDVRLTFTFRDPIEAFQLGAVPRSVRIGRTVPISEHVKTHLGSMDALVQMKEEYKGNPKVQLVVIDNSRGKDNAALSTVEFVKEKRKLYNAEELTKELNKLNEKNYKDGKITEAHYKGFKG